MELSPGGGTCDITAGGKSGIGLRRFELVTFA